MNDKISGDFIEKGVWKGGACIFMSGVLSAYNENNRKVFVADSFQGIPQPDDDYPIDQFNNWHTEKYPSVSLDEVKEKISQIQFAIRTNNFFRGLFHRHFTES